MLKLVRILLYICLPLPVFTVACTGFRPQKLSGSLDALSTLPDLSNSTWYVRSDGGTRWSTHMPNGQCNGKADVPYPGKGTDQFCAFRDVRNFWSDGSNTVSKLFPTWGWVGVAGDTYIIRGAIANNLSHRVGWNNNSSAVDNGIYFGLANDPANSGAPPPPSGTATLHTKILGENYAACSAQSARTQLNGGFGAGTVLNLSGVSYVDVQCLDITDFSSCGVAGQKDACSTAVGALDDYAMNGIAFSNQTKNVTLNNVRLHGLANAGLVGPTGDGVSLNHVDLIGNASAGWNADLGDQTTGNGTLLMSHYTINWNGCAEEYPIVDTLPYRDCTDTASGGYGDGFVTSTAAANPAWILNFDQGIISNNTKDGLDASLLNGPGTSMTITHNLTYGNMGQQLKLGGKSQASASSNLIVTNCNALRQAIPGTVAGYNSRLTSFCSGSDIGIELRVMNNSTLNYQNNTIYSAGVTGIDVECGTNACDATANINFSGNIFVGFANSVANGYPTGGTNNFSIPIVVGGHDNFLTHAGSTYSGNTTFNPVAGWVCPQTGESNTVCADPGLIDETWHVDGYGLMVRPN